MHTTCGGDLGPLHANSYRQWSARQARAIRMLITYRGETAPTPAETQAILDAVWDGRWDKRTKIAAYRIADKYWTTERNLAIGWRALRSVLQYAHDERPYWRTHATKTLRGCVAETGQEFYVEVYFT